MKNSSNLIQALKTLFKTIYYIHFPVIVYILINNYLHFFKHFFENHTYDITIKLVRDKHFNYSIDKICKNCEKTRIENTFYDLTYSSNDPSQIFIDSIYSTLIILLSAKFFQLIYQLFNNASNNKIFTFDSVKKTKYIGYLIIVFSLISFLFEALLLSVNSSFIAEFDFTEGFSTNHSSFIKAIISEFRSVIIGLIVLAFAEVLKRGVELQQLENETV